MGTASTSVRSLAALALVLLLALRCLAPAGFMPAFERGAVTIVACPDASGPIAPAHRHHGDKQTLHQPCPYAAASALGALPDQWAPAAERLLFGVALVLGRSFAFVERHRANERPHPTGPPIPA
jgi:hypothetical protein